MGSLEELAAEIKAGAAGKREQFVVSMRDRTDVETIRALASKYTANSEISLPLYERILELQPSDANAMAAIGWIYWSLGEDEQASNWATRARTMSKNDVQVLTLQAALETNRERKFSLYKQVLAIDPANRAAAEQLAALSKHQ